MAEQDEDSAGVYFLTREAFEARTLGITRRLEDTQRCDECLSEYYTRRSEMAGLCPECAHRLHGHPRCEHEFQNGRCQLCYWDGSVSEFLLGITRANRPAGTTGTRSRPSR